MILVSDLNFTVFYLLRNIAKVGPLLKQQDAEKLVHAFVFYRLDNLTKKEKLFNSISGNLHYWLYLSEYILETFF